jgi:hypothetical protein
VTSQRIFRDIRALIAWVYDDVTSRLHDVTLIPIYVTVWPIHTDKHDFFPLDQENYLFNVFGEQHETFEVILAHNAMESFQQKVPPILLGAFEDIFD